MVNLDKGKKEDAMEPGRTNPGILDTAACSGQVGFLISCCVERSSSDFLAS